MSQQQASRGVPGQGLWPLPGDLGEHAGKNAAPLRAYYFFRAMAEENTSFTLDDLTTATGWKPQTPSTYISKQWTQFIERLPDGVMRVNSRFLRLTIRGFMKNFTQARSLLGEYRREFHQAVVSYEFLLPLTKERELRKALDYLFYRDTLAQRLKEIRLDTLKTVIPSVDGESDEEYTERALSTVGGYFSGYSIVHVQGRFRGSDDVITREQAGAMLAEDSRYLIDESTASVRFIVPCKKGSRAFSERFGSVSSEVNRPLTDLFTNAEMDDEVSLIRDLFFGFFVEAVVDTVEGEDEIWLIETSPLGQRLFKWLRTY